MPAIALTDHDGLYAAPAFYKASKAAGIKSVIGAEFTLEEGFHVTLLARDREGYANLCRLVTAAQLAGAKGEPRLVFSRLAALSAGLICLSGCRRGEIPALLLGGKKAEALDAARRYLDVFGRERFFIELHHHLHPEDRRLCARLLAIAHATGVRPVATNNVHYVAREDHRLQDVLVCIKNRVTLDTSASFRNANSEYYLKGEAEMLRLPLPADAIHRAAEIAEACSFELDFSSYRFPDFPLPGGERQERTSGDSASRRHGRGSWRSRSASGRGSTRSSS